MRLYGIRLFVALLTFGVGVAAASLLTSQRRAACGTRAITSTPVLVAVSSRDEPPPPPPPRSCNYTVSGGILNGKAISKPQPAYPAIAKAARASGTVPVQVLVGEEGEVISARATDGHPLLQQAAVDAARQARFSPTLLSGRRVKVSGVITYNFVLQ